ncbi:MAG: DUF5658 family protein [Planctomycetota bacterium]
MIRPTARTVNRATIIWGMIFVFCLSGGQIAWSQSRGSSLSQSNAENTINTKSGYVFVDGEYLPPPYEISTTAKAVIINGQTFDLAYFGKTSPQGPKPDVRRGRPGRRPGMQGGPNARNGRGARQPKPIAPIFRQLTQVTLGATVVLFRNQSPLVVYPDDGGNSLLATLVENPQVVQNPPEFFAKTDRVTWDRLIKEYKTSDALVQRLQGEQERRDSAEQAGEEVSAANQLVSAISYPLTVFGMVAVVFAFGHLLSSKPTLDTVSGSGQVDQKIASKSLMIIAVFSALDLIWTLAATNAGTMRELNPLGSRIIADPLLLVGFKVLVTGSSIGILYSLQRYPVARVASWWCCLLLTLLTARWVVFQSMFA